MGPWSSNCVRSGPAGGSHSPCTVISRGPMRLGPFASCRARHALALTVTLSASLPAAPSLTTQSCSSAYPTPVAPNGPFDRTYEPQNARRERTAAASRRAGCRRMATQRATRASPTRAPRHCEATPLSVGAAPHRPGFLARCRRLRLASWTRWRRRRTWRLSTAGRIERAVAQKAVAGRSRRPATQRVMQPIARATTATELEDAVRWYAAARPPASMWNDRVDVAKIARGARLARDGEWSRKLPACSNCHGSTGEGVPPKFPVSARPIARVCRSAARGLSARLASQRFARSDARGRPTHHARRWSPSASILPAWNASNYPGQLGGAYREYIDFAGSGALVRRARFRRHRRNDRLSARHASSAWRGDR